ncbi:MAG: MYXO-CTERM sorting domain-containing protein, partial [Planctomycetota bacterium]
LDIDDLNLEGRWLELTTTSSQFEALQITVETNANDEGVFIDHIRWSQTVPSPGALAVLGLGAARSRRRK